MKHFVEPHSWLIEDIRMPPGIPWVVRLRLAGNEAPVNGCHFVFLGEWQTVSNVLPAPRAINSVQIERTVEFSKE